MRDTQAVTGIAVQELHGEEKQEVVATALAADLTLQPMVESEAQRVQRQLGSPYVLSLRNAAEQRCIEAARIKADLSFSSNKVHQLRRDEDHRAPQTEEQHIAFDNAFHTYKTSGQLLRDEMHRAHMHELNAGLHNLHEPFEGLFR